MKKTKILTMLPYRWKITLIILGFTCIPSLLFSIFYYRNAHPQWIKTALTSYYNTTDTAALLLSGQVWDLQSKTNYITNNSTIRTLIHRVEYLTLPLSLDMVAELENAVSAISADSPNLTVRWYPLRSTISYGQYCYPLQMLTEEFALEKEESHDLYTEITALSSSDTLWAFRTLSRDTNNTGPAQKRLCLYKQIGDLGAPDCILELTIPVTQYFAFADIDSIQGSLFAFCIPKDAQASEALWDLNSDAQNAEELLQQYQEEKIITNYYIVSSSIPNVEKGEVIFALPSHYVANLIRPQQTNFFMVSALIGIMLFYISYITASLLTRQYELNKLRMELEILQLRFNPHLLYNTLNALCFQIKNPAARNTIGSLCQYYRSVLNNGYLFIPVKNELEMIREYLNIECFAYALDNLQIEFDIDESILECRMIKHLLQPIVENALNHGIRPQDHGTLCISAKEEGEYIVFKISDNGVGMLPDKIAELLAPPKEELTGGYGVYNVEQRIHTYYGPQYGLKIDSSTNIGTTVTLKLPKEPALSGKFGNYSVG